jgi:hypothetical protein
MNKYVRDISLIIIYGFGLICQIVFSSYLIDKKDDLEDILMNYKNITECKDSAIYRLNNGSLINNTIAILISGCLICASFMSILLFKFLSKRYEYQTLDDTIDDKNNSIITRKLIPTERFDLTINVIFIASILCFIICNCIEFILQLNNIDKNCLEYIDKKIENFYTIYSFMTCTSFLTSYTIFLIIPCFL